MIKFFFVKKVKNQHVLIGRTDILDSTLPKSYLIVKVIIMQSLNTIGQF